MLGPIFTAAEIRRISEFFKDNKNNDSFEFVKKISTSIVSLIYKGASDKNIPDKLVIPIMSIPSTVDLLLIKTILIALGYEVNVFKNYVLVKW